MTQAYRIRSMAREEMGIALDWAAAEGWNPGLHDAPCFHAADPGGFLVGLLDGEPVATISVVRYGTDSGFLGFVEGGALKGYGLLRPCREGYKLGPLFADDPEIADRLFTALAASAEEGATIALDTPEINPQALELAQRHGMTAVFETARMYTGPAPELPLSRFYGVTSYELG